MARACRVNEKPAFVIEEQDGGPSVYTDGAKRENSAWWRRQIEAM